MIAMMSFEVPEYMEKVGRFVQKLDFVHYAMALGGVRSMLSYLAISSYSKVPMHPDKTGIIRTWNGQEGFDFLGMHHRRQMIETRSGEIYYVLYQYSCKKAMKRMRKRVKELERLGNS